MTITSVLLCSKIVISLKILTVGQTHCTVLLQVSVKYILRFNDMGI
nr:MAG TPA: hypothetical protein [Caudoviricetes sp.]